MNSIKKIAILFLVLFTGDRVFCQEINVSTTLDTTKFLMGDFIPLKIKIQHSKGVQPTIPQLEKLSDDLEFIDKTPFDTITENGLTTLTQTINYSIYEPGEYTIPAIPFKFHVEGDTTSFEISSDSIAVMIFSVLNPQDTAIALKDIKAPLEVKVPRKFKWWIFAIIGGVLLLGGIIAFVLTRKKQQATQAYVKPVTPKSAYETAIKKLHQLESEKLWQKEEVKLYYIRLTDIIREYIEGRFKVPAMESTTDEIIDGFDKVPVSHENIENLKYVLELGDFVKFAKAKPLPDEHDKCYRHCLFFVESTKPESETDKTEEAT